MEVSPSTGYFYPEDGLWWVTIPRQAANVTVRDHEGRDIKEAINQSKYLNRRLWFRNKDEVLDFETYTFNITYSVPRGVIIYGNAAYFNQILPFASCDDETKNKFVYPSSWEYNSSEIHPSQQREGQVAFGNLSSRFRIWFKTGSLSATLSNFQKGIFNVTVPSRYREHIEDQIEEANSFLPAIESEIGIKTPESFSIQYLPLRPENISEEAAGQYYGGKIEIKTSQLAKKEIRVLETILHETIHGYNHKYSFGSPDWWWEEGTTEYVTHNVLKEQGRNTSIFGPSRERIEATFEHCSFERNFISDWNPLDYQSPLEVAINYCNRSKASNITLIEDRDRLGYSYSELIVNEIFNKSSRGVKDVYSFMEDQNITFSNQTVFMNNQINYITSQVLGKDLTQFYRQRGIDVSPWEQPKKEIEAAKGELTTLEQGYPFPLFTVYSNLVHDVEARFLQGRFSATTRLSNILEEARARNQTAFHIYRQYQHLRENLSQLQSQDPPALYRTEQQTLSQALSSIKEAEFQKADDTLFTVKNDIREKRKEVSKYKKNRKLLKSDLESTSILFRPFLFGAPSKIEESHERFKEGDLKRAQSLLSKSKQYISRSKSFGILTYLITALIVVGLLRRKNRI